MTVSSGASIRSPSNARMQGKTMPAVPMHVASFQGPVTRFEVQASKQQQQPNRFRITGHSHMYVGQMRRMVAAKLGCPPEYLRLFAQGSLLLRSLRPVNFPWRGKFRGTGRR